MFVQLVLNFFTVKQKPEPYALFVAEQTYFVSHYLSFINLSVSLKQIRHGKITLRLRKGFVEETFIFITQMFKKDGNLEKRELRKKKRKKKLIKTGRH